MTFYWIDTSKNCCVVLFSAEISNKSRRDAAKSFSTMVLNQFGRFNANPILLLLFGILWCPQLQWSQQLAEARALCVGWGEIRKTEGGKEWGGEGSEGVVRGIIECLRGPHRHWAARQGEENGVEGRNKRLSQWEKQREEQQGSWVREMENTLRVNCWFQARPTEGLWWWHTFLTKPLLTHQSLPQSVWIWIGCFVQW